MREGQDDRDRRLARLRALRDDGRDPYLIERYARTHRAAVVVERFAEVEGAPVSLAGRVVSCRVMGRAAFADLQDETGRVQLYARRDDLGQGPYDEFRSLDIGDIVGVEGTVFRTRTGEISVHLTGWVLLAKCLRPLPIGKESEGKHFAGLSDVEQRYRMRYVDLLVNPGARDVLVRRSRMVQAVRRFLDGRGFLEVETPVLQEEAGGAAARPFVTHHNALDRDFKLRISLELYLKRLIVGGLDRVYEIGRVFRNEGVSTRHNPEFTMLELYQAYANLEDIMELVEDLYVEVCTAVNAEPRFVYRAPGAAGEAADEVIDLSRRPWRRLPILDGIARYAGITPEELDDLPGARRACERVGVPADCETTVGGLIEKLHERFTQPNLVQPTFVTDFPLETSPLAKKRPDAPRLTRRFEVYAATQELGNAFSEINDPVDQRERFENQLRLRAAGDQEAHPMDEDFLRALEYGMPPTGGLGIGIDRLAMVLMGQSSIRDVLLFPLLRPET
ncbi:MAG: lysine--tRNA ligase [Chthonomonadales bacterium]|nr:lysine--tRNA ligase [Chthonomonadales bacterium]